MVAGVCAKHTKHPNTFISPREYLKTLVIIAGHIHPLDKGINILGDDFI